ncbi:MAG: PLP-dependent aminotransferase family protein [Thermomicrobiales bacterium]
MDTSLASTTSTPTSTVARERTEGFDWSRALAGRTDRLKPSEIREFLKLLGRPGIISFAGGIPDPALFPAESLAATAAAILADPARRTQALQYAPSDGYLPLREWIAAHMTRLWAPCGEENILLTTGSQQALDLLGKVLLDPGDTVLTTVPAYLGALQAFEVYEPTYAALPDEHIGAHPAPGQTPTVAYVVPDFSNPSGETLTLAQRERLLDTAEELGIPVIEDAAYQALRFEGEALPSLLALDIMRTGSIERSRVVHTGTFSKTIAPGLRVGWICASRAIIQTLLLARQAADLHSSAFDQMLVHGVVETGFDAQIARILPVYRHRRDRMLAALAREMPEGVTWTRPEGGMFVWLTLPEGLDSRHLVRDAIRNEGIVFVPGTAFFPGNGDGAGGGSRHLRLNFTCSDDATIDDGIARLGGLIRRHRAAIPHATSRVAAR